MTTTEDATYIFAEAQADFTLVVGAPSDNDVKRLNEAFVNALQSIDVPGGAVDLSDIVLLDSNHKAKHGGDTTFGLMEVPLQAYNDSIAAEHRTPLDGKNRNAKTHQDS